VRLRPAVLCGICAALATGLASCNTAGWNRFGVGQSPAIYADLSSNSRQDLHRSLSFIAETGGPPVPRGAGSIDQFKRARESVLKWLQRLTERQNRELEARYQEFLKTWEPPSSEDAGTSLSGHKLGTDSLFGDGSGILRPSDDLSRKK